MFSDKKTAGLSDQRLKTGRSDYIFSRQKELVLDLVTPLAGERLLDIGCGTGNNLQIFSEKWCSLTGIDSSREKLEIARQKHGDRVELIAGNAEDIPFSDNEFDIVTIINFLEVADNPQKVIEEAIRVCRGRVFIGFLNNYSFFGTRQRIKETFGVSLTSKMRFFSFPEIRNMAEASLGDTLIKWGSVIYFPGLVYDFFEELEEMFPLRKNPFGAFIGLSFPVKYTYRTAQNPIVNSFKLKAEARDTAPEAIRNMLRQADK
jgi:SAM-dependent methyltransferase